MKTLEELFVHSLSEMQDVEKQLARALPKLGNAASDAALAHALDADLGEATEQVGRLERYADSTGLKLERVRSTTMQSLMAEADQMIDRLPVGPVRDAALIAAMQKAKHFEIACYGTLRALATELGHDPQAIDVLTKSLHEEKETDANLTVLAQRHANPEAARSAH